MLIQGAKGESLKNTIPEGTKIKYGLYVFTGCSSLPLAAKAKIKATGYTDGF